MPTWPDFWAAHDAEAAQRVRLALAVPFAVTDWLSLRPLTARDVLELRAIESPVVCGGACSGAQVALFLWLMAAPRNKRHGGWFFRRRQRRFAERIGREDAEAINAKIDAYFSETFDDIPGAGAQESPYRRIEYTVPMLAFLDGLADGCPIKVQQLLDVPIAFLAQLARVKMAGAGKPMLNKSDRIKHEILTGVPANG